MNTKLLASIAVLALLSGVVSTSMMHSAFADTKMADKKAKVDAKVDAKKAAADKKAADAKAKADKKAADAKAKADAKKTKMDDKMAGMKDTSSGKATSTVEVDMAKGASSPTCSDTNSCYLPHEATVAVGGTVTWVNKDSAAHYATSGKDATADGKFDSGMVMAGGKFSQKFDTAGTYDYFCTVHPWMTGEIIVK